MTGIGEDVMFQLLNDVDLEKSQFPKYLLDLLYLTGFGNIYVLSSFKEKDIAILEEYAKGDLKELLNEEQKKEFFGIYYNNINLFKIVEGHRRLLHILVEKCKKITNRKEISKRRADVSLNNSESSNDKRKRIHNSTNSETDQHIRVTEHETPINTFQFDTEYVKRSIEHISTIVKNYQIKFLNTLLDDNVKRGSLQELDNIKVEIKNNCAYITCPKCQFISKSFPQTEKGKQKWVLSNVNRHYKTHFHQKKQKGSASSTIKNSSILTFLRTSTSTQNENNQECDSRDESNLTPDVPFEIVDISEETLFTQGSTSVIEVTDNAISKASSSASSEISEFIDDPCNALSCQTFIENRVISENPINEEEIPVPMGKMPKRRERTLKARYLTFDSKQLKLTDFYEAYKLIEESISKNSGILNEFSASLNIVQDSLKENYPSDHRVVSPRSFLEFLKDAALKNGNKESKLKRGNRYSEEYKQFCLYIFLTAGRLAYETLAANTSNALPSLATLSRTLSLFDNFTEGDIQFGKLKEFLDKRNYPSHVFVSEDQTAIVGRIRYDPATNQLVGCVPLISKETGFPILNQFPVNSVQDVTNVVKTKNIANNAYVYMAQPLVNGAPAFCITIFGSDNKFLAENVLARWKYLTKESKRYGITIEGFSSDGDTRCLKAMKVISGLPLQSVPTDSSKIPYHQYFQANFDVGKPVAIQDTVHIATKLKTRILKPNTDLPMGKYLISRTHLENIIADFPKSSHMLCFSDLNGTDKMNFNSIDKMCATRVTNLLGHKKEFAATQRILIITRAIIDCFLDKSLNIKQRVYLIWYSTFFFRVWRAWVKEHPTYTLGKNWLTLNTYTCVELNAHGLILMLEKCRINGNSKLLLPWLWSSQPCEKFFRQTRSMTSTYATVVNFDLLDLIHRKHRICTINNIVSDSEKFTFPREKNKKMGTDEVIINLDLEIPSTEELNKVLEKAKLDALTHAHELEMFLPEELSKCALQEVSLLPVTNTTSNITYNSDSDSCSEKENVSETKNTPRQDATIQELNPEDLHTIQDEISSLEGLKEINVTDEVTDHSMKCASIKNINSSHLRICLNGKTVIVKKTTLCWLFSSKIGRLSSDRLHRVKGMTQQTKRRKKKIQNMTTKLVTEGSSDSDTSGEYASQSEFECEDILEVDDLASNHNDEIPHEILINLEEYYAVQYDTWYIGRVVTILDKNTTRMKFLKAELDEYIWPKDDDVQTVEQSFIFYGPIQLTGCGPFRLKRQDKLNIDKCFKLLKK